MKVLAESEMQAEMEAFEHATHDAFGHTPERHPINGIAFDWERAYVNFADSRRFAGWLMRGDTNWPPGEPRNGEDLLNHCRRFERLLTAMNLADTERTDALHSFVTPLARDYVPYGLATLRDSITTAEKSMRGES